MSQFNRTVAVLLFAIVLASNASGAVLQFIPNFDATLRDDGFDGTFDSGGNANPINTINRVDGTVNEIFFFEFDLSSVGSGSNIASATLSIDVFSNPTDLGDIEILAYQADGLLTFPDDGSRPAQVIGSYDPITLGSGVITISLNTNGIESILSAGDFLGIRMQGAETQASADIWGLVGSGASPTLTLDVSAVPEPSTTAALLMLCVVGVANRRFRGRKVKLR